MILRLLRELFRPRIPAVNPAKELDRVIERLEVQRCGKCGAWGKAGEEDADWGGCYTSFECPECHSTWGVYGFSGPRFGVFGG